MLKEILKNIERNKEIASRDPEAVPHEIAAVARGDIMRSKENLKELFYQYKNALKERVIFIMVNGKASKKFAETVDKNFSGMSFKAEEFYTKLVDQVDPQNYENKSLGNSMVDILSAVLENRALEIGVTAYPALLYKEKYASLIETKEDLVKVFSKMVNEQIGAEFVGVDLLDQAAEQAVKKRFSGSILPLVVYTEDNDLLTALAKDFYEKLTPNVFVITAGIASKEVSENSLTTVTGKITKKSVGEALKEVKNNLR
ncbi:MAG TPA: hypothetical protein VGA67_01795 [Candidatus Dojkabacteria bacterium]